MAVPAHDSRNYAFARHFGLEITPVVAGGDISKESYDAKEGKLINSGFLDGMEVREAIGKMFDAIEQRGLGKRLVNYRLRDAIFSRQRYWGEPFPIYYRDEIARPLPESALPLELPPVSDFGPTEEGEPPLARAAGVDDGRRRSARTVDDARVRRFVRLLPALHGPAQRPRARRPRSGRILAVGRPLRGRHRTCDGPPDVFALLEHVPLRSGLRVRARTLPEAGQPGHDPGPLEFRLPRRRYQQVRLVRPERVLRDAGDPRRREHRPQRPARSGRLPRMAARVRRRRVHPRRREIRLRLGDREDVEIDVQRRQPRLYRRPVRRRHAAHVRDVPRPARTVEAVGHERHRRRAQVPAPFLAALSTPATHWP